MSKLGDYMAAADERQRAKAATASPVRRSPFAQVGRAPSPSPQAQASAPVASRPVPPAFGDPRQRNERMRAMQATAPRQSQQAPAQGRPQTREERDAAMKAEYQRLCQEFPFPAYLEAMGWRITGSNNRTNKDGRYKTPEESGEKAEVRVRAAVLRRAEMEGQTLSVVEFKAAVASQMPQAIRDAEREIVRFVKWDERNDCPERPHHDHPGDRERGGEEIMVGRKAAWDDKWAWITRDGTAKGNVFQFMSDIEERGQIPDIKAHMQRFLDWHSADPTTRGPCPVERTVSNGKAATTAQSAREIFRDNERDYGMVARPEDEAMLAAKQTAKPMSQTQGRSSGSSGGSGNYNPGRVQWMWERLYTPGPNAYLRDERGIKPEVLATFASFIRNEAAVIKNRDGVMEPNPNRRGFAVAHTDEDGRVVGFERKGPKTNPTDARSFSMFAGGGQKMITRMTNAKAEQPLDRIYVGESVVDLMSVYQHDGQPKGVMLCSVYGQTHQEAYDEIGKLAAKHPTAEIHLCFDNDGKGLSFKADTEATVLRFSQESRIVDRQPPAAYKDWNDVVRGVTREAVKQARVEAFAAEFRNLNAGLDARVREAWELQTWDEAPAGLFDKVCQEVAVSRAALMERVAQFEAANPGFKVFPEKGGQQRVEAAADSHSAVEAKTEAVQEGAAASPKSAVAAARTGSVTALASRSRFGSPFHGWAARQSQAEASEGAKKPSEAKETAAHSP